MHGRRAGRTGLPDSGATQQQSRGNQNTPGRVLAAAPRCHEALLALRSTTRSYMPACGALHQAMLGAAPLLSASHDMQHTSPPLPPPPCLILVVRHAPSTACHVLPVAPDLHGTQQGWGKVVPSLAMCSCCGLVSPTCSSVLELCASLFLHWHLQRICAAACLSASLPAGPLLVLRWPESHITAAGVAGAVRVVYGSGAGPATGMRRAPHQGNFRLANRVRDVDEQQRGTAGGKRVPARLPCLGCPASPG